jgi:two-component system sensor histidine kinase KdpD
VDTRVVHVANPTIVALSFLLIVFGAAAQSTLRVAITVSLAATACLNFFFLPPTGAWTIAEAQNWFALFTFLVASVLISRRSSQARQRAQEAVARRDELTRLFELTRDILRTTDEADPLAAIAQHVVRRFQLPNAAIFQGRDGEWVAHHAGAPLGIDRTTLDAALDRTAGAIERHGQLGRRSGTADARTPDGAAIWLVPLRLGTAGVGILALEGGAIEPGTRDAIAGIVAIAIERQQLLDDRRESEVARRSAELRSTLLASLSHDLRTPLTALTVASNNLDAADLPDGARSDQVDVIRTEVDRLNHLFNNVVEMARIETHAVTPDPQWVQAAEIVDAARRQAGPSLAAHPLAVDVDDELTVHLDPRLTAAALAHLLENAAQYSPPGAAIDVRCWLAEDALGISVRDRGPGIAPADLDRVFDRFYRGAAGHRRFGTGMGLPIVRGLLAAEGGRVWAENAASGGACFTLTVPAPSRSMAGLVEDEP